MSGEPDYRLYFIGADGRFCAVRDLIASDDEDAIAIASAILAEAGNPPAELWQRARPVRSFAAKVRDGEPATCSRA